MKLGSQQLPDSEIQDFIKKACDRIDPILATRYKLPLPFPTPGIVESIAQDYAAAFILEKYYSGVISKEQIPQSKIYYDRAESDLKRVVSMGLIDNIPGVILVSPPQQMATPCIRSTTYKKTRSEISEALGKF